MAKVLLYGKQNKEKMPIIEKIVSIYYNEFIKETERLWIIKQNLNMKLG